MTHAVADAAPSGLIDGDGRGLGAPRLLEGPPVDLPLLPPPRPSAALPVQRTAAAEDPPQFEPPPSEPPPSEPPPSEPPPSGPSAPPPAPTGEAVRRPLTRAASQSAPVVQRAAVPLPPPASGTAPASVAQVREADPPALVLAAPTPGPAAPTPDPVADAVRDPGPAPAPAPSMAAPPGDEPPGPGEPIAEQVAEQVGEQVAETGLLPASDALPVLPAATDGTTAAEPEPVGPRFDPGSPPTAPPLRLQRAVDRQGAGPSRRAERPRPGFGAPLQRVPDSAVAVPPPAAPVQRSVQRSSGPRDLPAPGRTTDGDLRPGAGGFTEVDIAPPAPVAGPVLQRRPPPDTEQSVDRPDQAPGTSVDDAPGPDLAEPVPLQGLDDVPRPAATVLDVHRDAPLHVRGLATSIQRATVLPGPGVPQPALAVRPAGAPTAPPGRVVRVQRLPASGVEATAAPAGSGRAVAQAPTGRDVSGLSDFSDSSDPADPAAGHAAPGPGPAARYDVPEPQPPRTLLQRLTGQRPSPVGGPATAPVASSGPVAVPHAPAAVTGGRPHVVAVQRAAAPGATVPSTASPGGSAPDSFSTTTPSAVLVPPPAPAPAYGGDLVVQRRRRRRPRSRRPAGGPAPAAVPVGPLALGGPAVDDDLEQLGTGEQGGSTSPDSSEGSGTSGAEGGPGPGAPASGADPAGTGLGGMVPAAATAGGAAPADADAAGPERTPAETEELARDLFPAILRLIRREFVVERDRRGLRTDRW
ncbi:hypothetical protein [Nocardioides sp. SYSU DS0651]|uniref:hypothetical protein n=1 Tax=Nocardioides sp. SYSU DS0651 TaxID=3415955 RepID=UPI003F4C51F7